ncbi:MAG TPA: sigma-70 family RNA polymerase sigma factor [Chitinophagaceae bacterium]|nr:sigma-70 family RNA polymerase sigma factor [Chitinophagaceae bacterium]
MTNETELIEQLKQGDEAAFKIIVEQWQDMVHNTILGIIQNETEAEDLTQDVFIKVFEKIGTFKGDSKFSTWLYRIATTTALDHLRSKKRKKRFGFLQSLVGGADHKDQIPDFHHPGVRLDNKERATVLFKAIDALPENQKLAYTLHKLEGLSYRDVSEVLNTSVSAVESLMSRANQNLRKQLEEYYNKHYR